MSSTRPVTRCRAQIIINSHLYSCEMPGDPEHTAHSTAEMVDGRLRRVRWTVDYSIPIPFVEIT